MSSSEIINNESEIIALKALEFILADPNLQTQFLETSGMTAKVIHESIQNTDFLGGVLDFLLSKEESLVNICEQQKIDPTKPTHARDLISKKDTDQN